MSRGACCWGLAALLLACGCSGMPVAGPAPQQVLEHFAAALGSFEIAIEKTASAKPDDKEELSDDLRHRVGRLEQEADELAQPASGKAEAQAVLNRINQSLEQLRKATEGTPNLTSLRDQIRKLKSQAEELKGKL